MGGKGGGCDTGRRRASAHGLYRKQCVVWAQKRKRSGIKKKSTGLAREFRGKGSRKPDKFRETVRERRRGEERDEQLKKGERTFIAMK